VLSATACGTAGFIGGVICGVLSAGITSVAVLTKLGWIDTGIDWCAVLDNRQFLEKVNCSVETGLIWAFPLTGGFTGIGLGLWLNYQTNTLLAKGAEGMSGVPRKSRQFGALFNSLRFVFSSTRAQLLLMITIVGSAAGSILLFWHDDGPRWLQVQRSIGEGMVHYFGSLGLVIGYFLGVAPARAGKKAP
jgi:hypothetical protein